MLRLKQMIHNISIKTIHFFVVELLKFCAIMIESIPTHNRPDRQNFHLFSYMSIQMKPTTHHQSIYLNIGDRSPIFAMSLGS